MVMKLIQAVQEGKQQDRLRIMFVEQLNLSHATADKVYKVFRAHGQTKLLEDLWDGLYNYNRSATKLQTALDCYKMTVGPDPSVIMSMQNKIAQINADATAYRQDRKNYL